MARVLLKECGNCGCKRYRPCRCRKPDSNSIKSKKRKKRM